MRKIISKSLIVLNIILITVLIVLSGILVFFTSSKQTILNHTALLYTSNATTVVPKTSLIIINKENKSLKKDDKIIYNVTHEDLTNIQCVDVVASITDGIVTLKDNVTKIDISSPSYIGKVVFQNHLLGEIFSEISNNKNTTLIYIIIFGGVIIAGLSITLVFSIINRKNLKIAIDNPIEVITEYDNECDELLDDNVLLEEQQITCDSDSINAPQQVSIGKAMQEFTETSENNQSQTSYKIDGTSFSYEIYNEMVFVEESPSSNVIQSPPVTETTSSIDSLLDDIIKQAQEDFYKQQRYNEVTISEIKEDENCTL